ncbi:MAG TPA: hypothetical protein VGG03_22960 [Thermoanaerobaculia bacterium]|jgi:hypothetical protein
MGGLEPLAAVAAARLAGKAINRADFLEAQRQAGGLERLLARGAWVHDRAAGSRNTPLAGAAGSDRWKLIARVCEVEWDEGLGGIEHQAPGSYHTIARTFSLMYALRRAREAGDRQAAAAIAKILRAQWAFDVLSALPVPRRQDRVVIGGKRVASSTPECVDGLTVGAAGLRWTLRERSRWTSPNAHSAMLAWALDVPRFTLSEGKQVGPLGPLLGVGSYTDPTPPKPWGITAEERRILRRVLAGDVTAALLVSSWINGVKGRRGEAPPWKWTLFRTDLMAGSIYWGPWPNVAGGKPPQTYSAIDWNGLWTGLKCSDIPRGLDEYVVEWAGFGSPVRVHCRGRGWSEIEGPSGEVLWVFTYEGVPQQEGDPGGLIESNVQREPLSR